MAHMEGMAVHAAYEGRRAQGHLDADADYRVYVDPAAGEAARLRFAEVLASVPTDGPVPGATVGAVLEAMSSGERLWYRFGALACHRMEASVGRRRLVASLRDATEFEAFAKTLLAAHSPRRLSQ